MSRRVRLRSTSTPIILGSATVALAVLMLVSWILVVVNDPDFSRNVGQNTTLLVMGILSLSIIAAVLVLFSVVLVREILEVRRQVSFIDSVTHELKSPLASIKLCVDTVQRTGLSAEQREHLYDMMKADVDRLASFIDDVLVANRLSAEGARHEVSAVPLRALIDRCIERATYRHDAPPGAVTVEVPATLTLQSDPTALEIIVKNLIDNAVKYSDPPVAVRVAAERLPDGALHLSVRDAGIGLLAKDQKRILERFYRVDSEAVRRRRGTGLGLFVVSALVRGLGGRLRVESEGPERGTTMHVTLPARDPTDSAHDTASESA